MFYNLLECNLQKQESTGPLGVDSFVGSLPRHPQKSQANPEETKSVALRSRRVFHKSTEVEDRHQDREEPGPHADPEVVGHELQVHLGTRLAFCQGRLRQRRG